MATQTQGATNSGDIKGKIDQQVGKNETKSGYKYQYVNTEKNKKLGIITADNVNHILYNLLWDIVSHQVDNETARGEWKEVQWLLRRYPKDSDRSDDTGVSNETIDKYVKKAKDIIGGMKQVDEESIYVDGGKLTKHPGATGKKLCEEVNEEVDRSLLEKSDKFKYQLLDRMRSDCNYFLGNGNGLTKYLWADSIDEQIATMKALYNSFSDEDKPEWISIKEIEDLGKKMKNYKKTNEELNEGVKENLQHRIESAKALYKNSKESVKNDVEEAPIEEDATVGKYTIKKINDNGVEKYGVYDNAGNLRATYPDEQTAKDAVSGKKIYEEYDAFQDMKKVDDTEYRKGLYTDGNGSYYEAPSKGTTSWIKKKGGKFRYNFDTKEIELADNAGDIYYSAGLSLGNWLDGPDYWYFQAKKEADDEEEAYIRDYLKKHPEEDKKNISVQELKDMENLPEEEEPAAESEVNEEKLPEFKSAEDLAKYLEGKPFAIITFQKGIYQVVDED